MLDGIDGGAPREVGAVVGPNGTRLEYVLNEVIFHPADSAELAQFLSTFNGKVLRDGGPISIEGMEQNGEPISSGYYLVSMGSVPGTMDSLNMRMRAQGKKGVHSFSSEAALKLAAFVSGFSKGKASVNALMHHCQSLAENGTLEHPNGTGGFVNTGGQWWLTDGITQPGGLNIGVIRAWAYLRYKKVPPMNGSWQPPVLAIIDDGFAMDPQTGIPLNSNIDYRYGGQRPMQFNLKDNTPYVSGEGWGGGWHGQSVFGVAAAYPRNLFGVAGTGGEVVRPLLIEVDGSSYMGGDAVRAAAYNGASVINMSFGGDEINAFDWIDNFQRNVNIAAAYNTIMVAAAGNANQEDDYERSFIPGTFNNVICVGAMRADRMAETWSAAGTRVDIWAPDGILTTPDPGSLVSNPGGLPGFSGTSAASPFVAGVVCLMKALKPDLWHDQIVSILQSTALPSPDPKVTPGYVNALAAVMAVSPNEPPTIQILQPANGTQVQAFTHPHLMAAVVDPEQQPAIEGITVAWSSDRDGALLIGNSAAPCITGDSWKPLSPGTHVLTATVTDPFGATGSASVTVSVQAMAPTATVTYPADGSTIYVGQQLNLRGYGTSPTGIAVPFTLKWSSDISGALGTGASIWSTLPLGAHRISLSATDPLGQSGSTSIGVTVQATSTAFPTAQIQAPGDFTSFGLDATEFFSGTGTDPIDGAIPGANMRWSSNVDGFLGTGTSISVVLSGGACAPIYHVITLTVTNSIGNTATHSITVLVGQIC